MAGGRIRCLSCGFSAGFGEFDPVDITATARDGSKRSVEGYLAVPYDIPRGCAAGYMPEMNVLCAIATTAGGATSRSRSTSR